MKNILLIATGGTIASIQTDSGLSPQIKERELLSYVPEAESICHIDVVGPFSLDSTNVRWEQWLKLVQLLKNNTRSTMGS